MDGFRKFLLRGNVVDLAVAVIVGVAFGAVVTALVSDIITPIIGAFGGVPDFSGWTFTINDSEFRMGHFINAVLSFLMVATVVYFVVVLPVNTLMERYGTGRAAGEPTRRCPECLSEIPAAARRCAFCTAPVAAGATAGGAERPVTR